MGFSETAFSACLLGGAVGDALGHAIEFLDITSIRRTYGESGVTDLIRPEFTDDTQMTLFTAEALLRWHLQPDRRDMQLNMTLHQSYLRWLYTQGDKIAPSLRRGWLLQQQGLYEQLAPGRSNLEALRSGKMGSRDYPLNDSKGCGAVMRMAPMGLYFHQDPEKAFHMAMEGAVLTHGHPNGYLSAGFFASLIALLVSQTSLQNAASDSIGLLRQHPKHEELLQHVDRALDMHAGGLKATPETLAKMGGKWPGAVAEEALAMSLFCALRHEQDYTQGTLAAVNHSGDSDCVGLLTGQILGLLNGIDSIPEAWREKLRLNEIVRVVAADLYAAAASEADPLAPLSEALLQRYH